MTRNTRKRILTSAALTAVVAVGLFIDPNALFAAVPIFGAVVDGEGDADDGDGDAGDAGDGGDAHDYDLPEGVAGDDDGGDDGAADDPDDDPDDPNADPARSAGGKKPADNQMVPAYRLRQQQERFEKLLKSESEKTQKLLGGLREALGGKAGGASGDAPALTPDQERLRGQFLKLFPEFAELLKVAPKAGSLLDLAGKAPGWERETQDFWTNVAKNTSGRLFSHVAKELGLKKLEPEDREVVRDTFITWVKADKSGDRNHRYEGQDSSLVSDFWTWYSGRFRQPANRAGNANALRRSQQGRPLPRGGNASTQIPSGARPKKGAEDEDPFEAANSRAWGTLVDDAAARS